MRLIHFSRDKHWKWGNFFLLPTITIGWGSSGYAIELRWLAMYITIYDHPYRNKKGD